MRGDANVLPLDLGRVIPRYKHSQRRLILIDFEDTLWERDPLVERQREKEGRFEPPVGTVDAVEKLSLNPKNEVWLLSGLSKKALDEVNKLIPKVGLM